MNIPESDHFAFEIESAISEFNESGFLPTCYNVDENGKRKYRSACFYKDLSDAEKFVENEYRRSLYVNGVYDYRRLKALSDGMEVPKILTLDDTKIFPHAGITTVVEFTWRKRDTGGDFIAVERGTTHSTEKLTRWNGDDIQMCDVVYNTGALVGTSKTQAGAEAIIDKINKTLLGAWYHVVRREAVKIVTSSAPYGVNASERAA